MSALAFRQVCRRLAIVCAGAVLLYIAFAALATIPPAVDHAEGARFWPAFLPDWPIAFCFTLGVVFAACDGALWAVSVSAARSERQRLEKLAAEWLAHAEARMAAARGDPDLRVTGFRARPLPGGARLDWTAPAATYDGVLVLRSREAFALSPETARHQVVAYEGDDTGFTDQGLVPGRVYFYTAFAEARGAGQWSPPAWASATTPAQSVWDVALRHLWTLRR